MLPGSLQLRIASWEAEKSSYSLPVAALHCPHFTARSSQPAPGAAPHTPRREQRSQIASGEHILKKAQQFRVNRPIRSQNFAAVELERLAGKAAG